MANCCENILDAAEKGHTNCITYLRNAGHPWHPETTHEAAYYGHNDALRLLHELGCPWHPETTLIAARKGNEEILILLHELGCPWHPDTTWSAAFHGHGNIDVLKYIYENCGDDISWEASGLAKYKDDEFSQFDDNVKKYIGEIEESWKCGMNRTGYALKPARDK